MAEKSININGKNIGYGTGISIDENLEVSTEKTFDGPVNFGIDGTEYTISIDKLIAEDMERYDELRGMLKSMRVNRGPVTITEKVRAKSGDEYTITQRFLGCLVSSYSKEISVDSLTTESIEFTAQTLEEEIERIQS